MILADTDQYLYLYLDDSGIRDPFGPPPIRHDKMDWFALGGIMFKGEDLVTINALHSNLSQQFGIQYPLHSTKIRGARDNFRWMKGSDGELYCARGREFLDSLTSAIIRLPAHVTGCVIHRPGYQARYKDQYQKECWPLCKTAYTIAVERAAKVALKWNRKLRIYVEATGEKEDARIKCYHQALLEKMSCFCPVSSGKYNPLTTADFKNVLAQAPNFVKKDKPAIQFSDLVAYPIVAGRYDSSNLAYNELVKNNKLIDSCFPAEAERLECGIKYSCFDEI
ncbi:DUF3800 domain-containing protein [Verrucomicrobia bacterium LW23]|nr:DUF3800 domain-containing protein [Verrucomicrobia bacterium LW23]